MPTVLLVDVSASLGRLVTPSDEDCTRLQLVRTGLTHFLQRLENEHPEESACLITYSSTTEVVCPFTRDFGLLIDAIDELELQDKTNLANGLDRTKKYVLKSCGADSLVRIIVVTDGTPNMDDPLRVSFPFLVNMHIVAFGDRRDIDTEFYDQLASKNSGTFQYFQLPQTERAFTLQFEELLETHYKPCKGMLMLGHLLGEITLFPSPQNSVYPQVAMDNDLPLVFPNNLSIIGFVHTNLMSSPPSLIRFVLFPRRDSDASLVKMLNETLKKTRKAGLVCLENNWFALLHSHTESLRNEKKKKDGAALKRVQKSALVLTVMPRNVAMPWIGQVSGLTSATTDPQNLRLPKREPYPKSYNFEEIEIPSISEGAARDDLLKVIEFVEELPNTIAKLYDVCQKMRHKAAIFSWNGLVEMLITLLEQLKTSDSTETVEDEEEKQVILTTLIEQLRTNADRVPLQLPEGYGTEEVNHHYGTRASKRSGKMDILNLLT